MCILNVLEKLRQVDTNSLAKVMNISPNMARKYKREPWKHDPPSTKAIAIEDEFGIPVSFWRDIRIAHNESVTDDENNNKVPNKKVR